ncbi:hypothetical protein B0J17DRAFT_42599 [Rhizoctonia solani]|nr:hypothetical protein B0J17DRAFT_42599 [Rhizoctonia solani]
MTITESSIGCLTCNSEHEKCHEIQPRCLPCQKSGIESPGYTGSEDPNMSNEKPRTLPAPLTEIDLSRATVHQGIPLADSGEGSGEALPKTFDPVRPLGALFSLGQLLDVVPPLQDAPPISEPSVPLIVDRSPPFIKRQDDVTTSDDEDSEGIVSVICRQLVLDKTAESNALPLSYRDMPDGSVESQSTP